MADLYLSGDADADQVLSTDPFALLVGMVLDQQIPGTAHAGSWLYRDAPGGTIPHRFTA